MNNVVRDSSVYYTDFLVMGFDFAQPTKMSVKGIGNLALNCHRESR
jgi:hypothetical protein